MDQICPSWIPARFSSHSCSAPLSYYTTANSLSLSTQSNMASIHNAQYSDLTKFICLFLKVNSCSSRFCNQIMPQHRQTLILILPEQGSIRLWHLYAAFGYLFVVTSVHDRRHLVRSREVRIIQRCHL